MQFVHCLKPRFPVLFQIVHAGDLRQVIEIQVDILPEKLCCPGQRLRRDMNDSIAESDLSFLNIFAQGSFDFFYYLFARHANLFLDSPEPELGVKHEIQFPLIRSADPGSIEFANSELEQILAAEDLEDYGKSSGS